MRRIEISGSSDDIICIDGDIRGEKYGNEADVMCSDGSIVHIEYGSGGVWNAYLKVKGTAKSERIGNEGSDSPNYSDKLILEGDIDWCCIGEVFTP